jgi:HD containing hydrolase-like enzyme
VLISDPRLVVNGFAVKRYHTVRTIQVQTVGEHTGNMIGLLHCFKYDYPRELIYAIITHDLPEQFTGDVPAPAKKSDEALDDALMTVEDNWKQMVKMPEPQMEEKDWWLLTWLDVAEMICFCHVEIAMGNIMMRTIYKRASEYITAHMNDPRMRFHTKAMQAELVTATDNLLMNEYQ